MCCGKDKAGRTNLSHTVGQFLDLLLKVILPLSSLKREVGQVRGGGQGWDHLLRAHTHTDTYKHTPTGRNERRNQETTAANAWRDNTQRNKHRMETKESARRERQGRPSKGMDGGGKYTGYLS